MNTPIRIQRKRVRGWRMPENTVYVGRPSIYGNDHEITDDNPQLAVDKFERDLLEWRQRVGEAVFERYIARLRGKYLACWCSLDRPCHADILLKLANQRPEITQ